MKVILTKSMACQAAKAHSKLKDEVKAMAESVANGDGTFDQAREFANAVLIYLKGIGGCRRLINSGEEACVEVNRGDIEVFCTQCGPMVS